MIDHQIDEEMILRDEVSDEAVECAAGIALGGFPTLPHTYCFACPAGPAFGNRKGVTLAAREGVTAPGEAA
jgi:hypothetical protein